MMIVRSTLINALFLFFKCNAWNYDVKSGNHFLTWIPYSHLSFRKKSSPILDYEPNSNPGLIFLVDGKFNSDSKFMVVQSTLVITNLFVPKPRYTES
ncbi:hypothetical protein RIR_jg7253.t1 [Rhizophagus irregularis DAOM 181602=DAOM 197198]|nr:hypothetical protein RIR_jg7253.t1 [Rhizophagus irregularis DAOM 181602=DAOM 197198]